MKCRFMNDSMILQGLLDEAAEVDQLKAWFDRAATESSENIISIDFAEVKFANSAGILNWIKALGLLKKPIIYKYAPGWLVTQFNMVPQLLNNENSVHKIEIPFYNGETEKETVLSFEIGKDIPILKSYKNFSLEEVEVDGRIYVADVIPLKYFDFIVKNPNVFLS